MRKIFAANNSNNNDCNWRGNKNNFNLIKWNKCQTNQASATRVLSSCSTVNINCDCPKRRSRNVVMKLQNANTLHEKSNNNNNNDRCCKQCKLLALSRACLTRRWQLRIWRHRHVTVHVKYCRPNNAAHCPRPCSPCSPRFPCSPAHPYSSPGLAWCCSWLFRTHAPIGHTSGQQAASAASVVPQKLS